MKGVVGGVCRDGMQQVRESVAREPCYGAGERRGRGGAADDRTNGKSRA